MGFTSNCPKSDKTQKRGRKNAKWRSKVKGKKGGEFFFVKFFSKKRKSENVHVNWQFIETFKDPNLSFFLPRLHFMCYFF